MHYQRKNIAKHGFTIIELLIVLIVGVGIIAMSASKMGEIYEKSKITKCVSNLLALATTINEYANNYGKSSITNENLLKYKLIPKGIKVLGNNILHHDWDSTIDILPDGTDVTIKYTGLPGHAILTICAEAKNSGLFSAVKVQDDKILTNQTKEDFAIQINKINLNNDKTDVTFFI